MVSIKVAFDLLALFLANCAAYHLMASLQTADAMLAIKPNCPATRRFVRFLTAVNATAVVCFLLAAVAVWSKWPLAIGLIATPMLFLLYAAYDSKQAKKTPNPAYEVS